MALDTEDLRLSVYRGFAGTGRAPGIPELAERLAATPDELRKGLRELHEQRHLVLDDADRVVMAHPFSAVPLGFAVMGEDTLWWGGCAWDSFALPALLGGEVLVSTRCPGCGTPQAWSVNAEAPPPGDQVAHFLVPTAHMWDDVVHTCGNQRLFCGEACVARWLEESESERGYVMDLPTLWRLARRWYDGRLDRGYTRREPTAALAYLRQVGLSGPFWGL